MTSWHCQQKELEHKAKGKSMIHVFYKLQLIVKNTHPWTEDIFALGYAKQYCQAVVKEGEKEK